MDIKRMIAGLMLFGWQLIKQAFRYVTLWLAGTGLLTLAAFSLDSHLAMTVDEFATLARISSVPVFFLFLINLAVFQDRAFRATMPAQAGKED